MDKLRVQCLEVLVEGWGWTTHVKVQRESGKGRITWDQLQQVKDTYIGKDARAIEVFPRANEIVNDCNMRHLWAVPEGVPLPNLIW